MPAPGKRPEAVPFLLYCNGKLVSAAEIIRYFYGFYFSGLVNSSPHLCLPAAPGKRPGAVPILLYRDGQLVCAPWNLILFFDS